MLYPCSLTGEGALSKAEFANPLIPRELAHDRKSTQFLDYNGATATVYICTGLLLSLSSLFSSAVLWLRDS